MIPATILPVLNAYPPDLRPSGPVESLGGAGGTSGSAFWRFTASSAPFALRAWPVDGPDPIRLTQIHLWMRECFDLGILPIPERTLDGRTFLSHGGRLWELSRWLPGSPSPLSPVRPEHVRRALGAIARFHRRLEHLGAFGPSPGLRKRTDELGEFLARTNQEYEHAIRLHAADLERELALQWLTLARREAPAIHRELARVVGLATPIQPCSRDLRHPHLLFQGDNLTGLVDFGAMGVDSVAGDLARLIGDWFPNDRLARAGALLAYEAVRPLSTIEHCFIHAFERANSLLIGAHWVRWRFVDGRVFESSTAASEGLRKSIEQLRR